MSETITAKVLSETITAKAGKDEHEIPANVEALREQRKARKAQKKVLKEEKRKRREIEKVQNALKLDSRAHIRMAASASLYGTLDEQIRQTATNDVRAVEEKKEAVDVEHKEDGPAVFSLLGLGLTEFSLALLPGPSSLMSLTSLDLSHNQLSELPGIESLQSLTELDLTRNCFKVLPSTLRLLPKLTKLNASRNDLRPNAEFLVLLLQPPGLPSLELLNITFNKKCYTKILFDELTSKMPNVAVKMTVTHPPPPGAKVGGAACDRDATKLRSQLEPYTVGQLRIRLVDTFGEEPHPYYTKEPPPPRAEVMERLLKHYAERGERKLVRVNGIPVDPDLLSEILKELKAWAVRNKDHHERPMIHADTYMILRSPSEFEQKLKRAGGSRKAHPARLKFEQNKRVWQLAHQAMESVDPDFAKRFTGLAVTNGFRGSPHIDTSNIGPFYGLALGNFTDGTGGIQVELDPLTVAEVNTKNRLGKVDGRYPHWVAPYDERLERFSLIYYQTEGEIIPRGTAVFGKILKE